MRVLPVATLLATAILAGCFGGGKEDTHETYQCPNGGPLLNEEDFADHDAENFTLAAKCPKGSGGNSTANTTSRAPNVLPTLVFKTSADDGTETNITLLGGNLTFDATGSMDPDGNITGLAASVTDSNTTRTLTLFDFATKTFTPQTIALDRPGRVAVTVAVVDDRGGFATLETMVFVDHPQAISWSPSGSWPGAPASNYPEDCVGPAGTITDEGVIDATYFTQSDFAVEDDASWIEATVSGVSMVICDPTGATISNRGGTVETTEGVALPAARGVDGYFLGMYKTGAPGGDAVGQVIVHYGPRPAAEA